MLGKPVNIPAPERNGFMKKVIYFSELGALGIVSGVCCVHSAVVFWLLFSPGQSSAVPPYLQWQCLDFGQSVVSFN